MAGWHHQLNGHRLGGLRELVIDREAWHAVVHGVAKSRTRLPVAWALDRCYLSLQSPWKEVFPLHGFPGGSVGKESTCNTQRTQV